MSPRLDRVVTIKSRNFYYCESLVFSGYLYWSTRGCNLAAHSSIHASFILRRGLTRFQLPNGFLGLRIIESRNPSDILELGPVVIKIGNITLFLAVDKCAELQWSNENWCHTPSTPPHKHPPHLTKNLYLPYLHFSYSAPD